MDDEVVDCVSLRSYVRANSGQTSYTFVIPMTGCGTRTFDDDDDDGSTGFQNMILVQNEELVQEAWDSARTITCDWTTRLEKLVTFRPFAVDVLQAREVRYSSDDVMCWMDIQLGQGPFSTTLDGIVKIGEELTVVIYAQDGGLEYDMLVKNCFAYDSEDTEDEKTTRLQLSDERGCLLKPKLLSSFNRTRNTGSSGADIITYATLFAFKFPDKMDVYLSCEVELCKEGCTSMCEEPGSPANLISRAEATTATTSRPPPSSVCLARPGSPQCCARSPSHPACPTTTRRPDPCDGNPNLLQCCDRNPSLPQCTATTRPTTAATTTSDPCIRSPGSFQCCLRNPNHLQCTTTATSITSSTTPGPEPCDTSPGSPQCCTSNPDHPRCTSTTIVPDTTISTTSTTTPGSDPCMSDPASPGCCATDPSQSGCVTEAPCSGRDDPRPQCQPTTTPHQENTALQAWLRRSSSGSRRSHPPYGTRLSPDVLAEPSKPRRRRDVALSPTPPPLRNTVAMMRGFRVVGANDLTFPTPPVPPISASSVDSVCLPRASFTVGLLMLSLLLITAVLVATFTSLRLRALDPCRITEARNLYYKQ